MSAESPSAEPVENRRPWYRLHLSTLLVLLLAAGLLVLIVVPGDLVEMATVNVGAFFGEQRRFEHGWPGVYLRRSTVYQGSAPEWPESGVPWLSAEAWQFSAEGCDFRPATLALDAAAVLAVLAALGAAVEWRRRRHHRVWQFGLAEILLLTLFIAGLLGWYQHNRLQLEREKELAWYPDAEHNVDTWVHGSVEYCGPVWLRRLAGASNLRAFYRVTEVSLGLPSLDDEQLRQRVQEIGALPYLKSLEICSGQVTDAGLSHLAQLPHLRELFLATSRVTNAGLVHLRGLRRLESLHLSGTAITDDGLKHLSGLTDLRSLYLLGADLNGSGLIHLSGLKRLEFLSLVGTHASDESVGQLREHLPDCFIVQYLP